VALVVLAGAVACEPQKAGLPDAAATESALSAAASAPSAAPDDPSARMAKWEHSRSAALEIPCRAIAVDGEVLAAAAWEGSADAAAPDGGVRLTSEAQIPAEGWLSLGREARLVAKDPRTTRETSFEGPAHVRACVEHREESWLATGRFESTVGAGETPGAEEWVVTPFGVIRYMAGKIAVDVRAQNAAVAVGSGTAFLLLDDGIRATPSRSRSTDAGAGADGGAAPVVDDDGWLRMGEGEVILSGPARPPIEAARAAVDRCDALGQRAQQLAAELFAAAANPDGSTAKQQMRTRRQARAACAIAALHVDTLPPSAPKGEMSGRLDRATAAWAAPPAAGAQP
jgi:hypothetical protein